MLTFVDRRPNTWNVARPKSAFVRSSNRATLRNDVRTLQSMLISTAIAHTASEGASMPNTHTHPKDCPDRKEAAGDRARREALAKEREARAQIVAHEVWFNFYPKR